MPYLRKKNLMKGYSLLVLILTGSLLMACKGKKDKSEQDTITDIPEQQPITVSGMRQDTIEFPSADGLTMRAVMYSIDSTSPVIVLCHQAKMNNYEYAEIAPKLNAMGYNCLALDQRSGGAIDAHDNKTNANALAANKATSYPSSLPDIEAGVNLAYETWGQPVILWGSSYSASLCLKVAMDNEHVKAVIGFSPIAKFDDGTSAADYFKNYNTKPIFITSTEKEAGALEKAFKHLPENVLTQFYPDTKGTHGSKALWSSDPANEYYWEAVTAWLQKNGELRVEN